MVMVMVRVLCHDDAKTGMVWLLGVMMTVVVQGAWKIEMLKKD